jgi:hypothetical protein
MIFFGERIVFDRLDSFVSRRASCACLNGSASGGQRDDGRIYGCHANGAGV